MGPISSKRLTSLRWKLLWRYLKFWHPRISVTENNDSGVIIMSRLAHIDGITGFSKSYTAVQCSSGINVHRRINHVRERFIIIKKNLRFNFIEWFITRSDVNVMWIDVNDVDWPPQANRQLFHYFGSLSYFVAFGAYGSNYLRTYNGEISFYTGAPCAWTSSTLGNGLARAGKCLKELRIGNFRIFRKKINYKNVQLTMFNSLQKLWYK